MVPIKSSERNAIAQSISLELGEQDLRPKLVLRPDCTLIWHSAGAQELLKPPLPIRIENDRLRFDEHIRPDGIHGFLEDAHTEVRRCLLRSKVKGHWVLLKAWPLREPLEAVVVVCSLSIPCRAITDSGLAAELRLTRSEAQVLDLFAMLLSPAQIADQLAISLGTVRSHLKQIYSKAGLGSAVQLLQLTRGYCANY